MLQSVWGLHQVIFPSSDLATKKRARFPYLFVSQINRLFKEGEDVNKEYMYFMPGHMGRQLDWRRERRAGRPRTEYACPNPLCSIKMSDQDDVACHLMLRSCVPTEGYDDMKARWWEEDKLLKQVVDGAHDAVGDTCAGASAEAGPQPAGAAGQADVDTQASLKPMHSKPELLCYQWPLKHGVWCVTELQASLHFPRVDDMDLAEQHPELDLRWVTAKERSFLVKSAIIEEKMAPSIFRVFKAREIERLVTYSKEKRELALKLAIESASFKVGSVKIAQERASLAMQQASQYNASMAYERRQERVHFYEFNTQLSHYPSSKLLKTASGDRSVHGARPVAVAPGQFQDPCLR